jgi:oligopeptide transport system ATP-binding protein
MTAEVPVEPDGMVAAHIDPASNAGADPGGLLLSIRDLSVSFRSGSGTIRAVRGVDVDVHRNEVVAVVGESGSGKSVTAMAVLGLLDPSSTSVTGQVEWLGEDLLGASPARLRQVRGGEIGLVFQDPLASLNPVLRVGRQVAEVIRAHEQVGATEALRRAVDMLELVGIPEPERRARMYPHEFSGGMRQRVMIAMAVACRPTLLIADEPTTALDVTVQAQVLDVLMGIQAETGSGVILVTHDLGMVAGIADRVVVMYAGRAVEEGTVDAVFSAPAHPYTMGLHDSLPDPQRPRRRLRPIVGSPPSPLALPSGCSFHPRCPHATSGGPCTTEVPPLREVGRGQQAACHLVEELRAVMRPGPEDQ